VKYKKREFSKSSKFFIFRGSLRSPFSKRDPEYNLLYGALNFLYITNDGTHRLLYLYERCN
jgi:hypothetical protein